MISKLHDRLGTAGLVVAVVALVAALAGTAFAAAGLNGKQKKEVKSIAKSFQGKGPKGDTGAAGAAGANGKDGTNGKDGANGKDGTSVTTAAATVGECPTGGVKVMSASPQTKVCNGEEGPAGEPWTAGGTLPTGATETGAWMFSGTYGGEGQARAQIDFTLPLAAALGASKVHLINKNGQELLVNVVAEETEEVAPSSDCAGGSAANPKAVAGSLCVYAGKSINKIEGFFGSNLITDPSNACVGLFCDPAFGGPGAGASKAGAIVSFEYAATGAKSSWGTWAVTGA